MEEGRMEEVAVQILFLDISKIKLLNAFLWFHKSDSKFVADRNLTEAKSVLS